MDSDANIALECHQAGCYADAARAYHALLVREPENANALHLFGVLHHQCGYHERAVELITRALALRPGAAVFHANLAEAHRALGQEAKHSRFATLVHFSASRRGSCAPLFRVREGSAATAQSL
jgi:predicted Zn-dependent protease